MQYYLCYSIFVTVLREESQAPDIRLGELAAMPSNDRPSSLPRLATEIPLGAARSQVTAPAGRLPSSASRSAADSLASDSSWAF